MLRRWGALGSLTLTSCSLLTSVDGLSGGAADAGTDAPSGIDGAADAMGDGGTSDGDSAAPGKAFCMSTVADFCADFDQGSRDVGWTDHDTREAGTLELDTTKSVSPPGSLRATWPRVDVGGSRFQQLFAKFGGAARPMTLDVDVFVEPIAWNANDQGFSIMELYFDEPEKTGALLTVAGSTWALVTHTPTELVTSGSGPFPTGAWTHVHIDAVPKASGGSVTMSFDDVVVAEMTNLSFAQNPTETQLWVGLGASSAPVPAVDVRYDNVVVKFR